VAQEQVSDLTPDATAVKTSADLGLLLRQLLRREARLRDDSPWTYRELAAKTGWSLGSIARYLDGKVVPPTDRFDALVRLLGATAVEQGAFATARDRVAENRRLLRTAATFPGGSVPGGSVPRQPIPRQLPANLSGFNGRTAQLAELDRVRSAAADGANTVIISAVHGTAGVGKTALAVYWAHRVADDFPDGQLYVNLRGFDPDGQVMTSAEAVRRFLDALGVPADRIPPDPDAQSALYRSELAGRRMLVVLDNARDSAQIRPLLPNASSCLVLITSRNQLSGLVATNRAHPIRLDLPTPAEARQMLACRLGAQRLAAEPEAASEIIEACARLPLALAVVAARAALNPDLPLSTLAGELRDASTRLDMLSTDDPAACVRTVFSWSYQTLTPDAARLFRLLGIHPGPEFSAPAAASLAGIPRSRVRNLLAELTGANLLVEVTYGRYTFHDLLRAYASGLAQAHDSDGQRYAATHRILDHYLHTAYAADRLLDPSREPITLQPHHHDVAPERPTDHAQAMAWFAQEHPVLITAVSHAAAGGYDRHAWQLAWTLEDFLDRICHWHDLTTVQHAALAAARRLADPSLQAQANRVLAAAYTKLGLLDVAHARLRHALDLYQQIGNLAGQATTHLTLGMLWCRQGRHSEALDHAVKAIDLYRFIGDKHGQGHALNSAGWYQALLGNYPQALTCCGEALTLLQSFNDRPGQANAWDSLGYAHHHLGDHAQALACYQHGLDLILELGYRYGQANALIHIGDTHLAAGNPCAAGEAWRQALAILQQLGNPDEVKVRTRLAALPGPRLVAHSV